MRPQFSDKSGQAVSLRTHYLKVLNAPVAQLDRVSGYGPEGWGFESSRAYRRQTLLYCGVCSIYSVLRFDHSKKIIQKKIIITQQHFKILKFKAKIFRKLACHKLSPDSKILAGFILENPKKDAFFIKYFPLF